jgi:ElaB/YqjD/DUF883 family membrane-anchored ribosome-binding protein
MKGSTGSGYSTTRVDDGRKPMATATRRNSYSSPASRQAKTDRLAADFHTFVGHVEQALENASHLPGDVLSTARSELEEQVAQARARLADASSAVGDGVGELRETIEASVRARPWTWLGLAAAVGAVAGVVLLRRG